MKHIINIKTAINNRDLMCRKCMHLEWTRNIDAAVAWSLVDNQIIWKKCRDVLTNFFEYIEFNKRFSSL